MKGEVLGECPEERVPATVASRLGPLDDQGPAILVRCVVESTHELEDETSTAPIVVGGGEVAGEFEKGESVLGQRFNVDLGHCPRRSKKSAKRRPRRLSPLVLVYRDHRLADTRSLAHCRLGEAGRLTGVPQRDAKRIAGHMHKCT